MARWLKGSVAPSRGDHALGRVACHSSGKTYTLAQILLWWLVRWPDAIAVTTAPTDRQVEKLLWGEIHKAIARCPYPLFPDANLTELRIAPGAEIGASREPSKRKKK